MDAAFEVLIGKDVDISMHSGSVIILKVAG
jgi:hypothetical protein